MRIIGALGGDGSGPRRLDAVLPHGHEVERLAWEHGCRYVAPLAARRDGDGELEVLVEVAEPRGPEPALRPLARDADLVLAPGEAPVRRQRIAAYALVCSDRGLLVTEYSDRTSAQGAWGLPGGGLDPGEEPAAAVAREVHEETAQRVQVGALTALQTSHWVGRAPQGRLEDFHAVRLVYRASCPDPGDPVVLDVGGTTSQARWVRSEQLAGIGWTPGWRRLLQDCLIL